MDRGGHGEGGLHARPRVVQAHKSVSGLASSLNVEDKTNVSGQTFKQIDARRDVAPVRED